MSEYDMEMVRRREACSSLQKENAELKERIELIKELIDSGGFLNAYSGECSIEKQDVYDWLDMPIEDLRKE